MPLLRSLPTCGRLTHRSNSYNTNNPSSTLLRLVNKTPQSASSAANRAGKLTGGLPLSLSELGTGTGQQARVLVSVHKPLSSTAPLSLISTSFSANSSLPTRDLSTTMTATQKRNHGGHSHSHGHGAHSHSHDNTYLTSSNKNDAGVRITRIGLYVNLSMAIGKGIGGYVFNSKALIADAIHALTDLVSDIMTLATVSWSLKPPSSQFPTGYGKVESLGSLGVSGLLLVGGLWMGVDALTTLLTQVWPEVGGWLHVGHGHGHSHSHSHVDMGPNVNAAWLAGISIIVKEWLYRSSESCHPLFLLQ